MDIVMDVVMDVDGNTRGLGTISFPEPPFLMNNALGAIILK